MYVNSEKLSLLLQWCQVVNTMYSIEVRIIKSSRGGKNGKYGKCSILNLSIFPFF